MSEATTPQGVNSSPGAPSRPALILSVLIFVVIYAWGLVWGLRSLSESRPRVQGEPAGRAQPR